MSLSAKLAIMGTVIREGDCRELITRFMNVIYSSSESYVLRRDLTVPLVPRPEAKIPISVRPLETSDMPQIIAERPAGLLLGILRAGLPQCYVAVTPTEEICFLQWLVTPDQRERFRSIRFRDMYEFNDDTVLLEFAYTFRRFRGLGIMAAALAWVAEQDKQARWAIAHVDRTNIASLRGCHRAGFDPYRLSRDRWRLFRLIQTIETESLESFWTQDTKS